MTHTWSVIAIYTPDAWGEVAGIKRFSVSAEVEAANESMATYLAGKIVESQMPDLARLTLYNLSVTRQIGFEEESDG